MRRIRIALSILLLLLLSASLAAQETGLRIVASHSIAADVLARVAGADAEVTTLIPRGSDPHSYHPAPSDLRALADADLVFINGAGHEEGLLAAIELTVAEDALVTLSDCVSILSGGHDDHNDDDDHAGEVHAGDEDAHHEELEALCGRHTAELGERFLTLQDDQASPGPLYAVDCSALQGCDPHVWLLPRNVALWTLMARDVLASRDSANATAWQTRSEDFLDEIAALEQELLPLIATLPQEQRLLVSNHLTFSYFAAGFGFETPGSVLPGTSTLAEPGVAQLAALIDLVRAYNLPAIFGEATASNDVAQQVAAESGAQLVLLQPDSLGEAGGPADTWLGMMRNLVTTIVASLQRESTA